MYSVNPQAEPFLVTGSSDAACLFIHGFTASPAEMYPLAKIIHEKTSCTVSGLLLPGHGSHPRHLNEMLWPDWYAAVEQELSRLLQQYRRVFVIGLSMGALLAMYAAYHFKKVQGVVAINAPVFVYHPLLAASAGLIKMIRPYYPKRTNPVDSDLEKQGRFAYSVIPVKAFMSMRQLKDRVMDIIDKINQPLLVFQSCQDESVIPESGCYIYEHASSSQVRLVELQNSRHIATMGGEKDILAREIIDFMDKTALDADCADLI
jgi:carboxylesterase